MGFKFLQIAYLAPVNRTLGIVLAGLLMLIACQESDDTVEVTEVEVDGLYAINLPDFLRPSFDMHDYASLQYYDNKTDFYIMGIDDPKDKLGSRRRRLKLKAYYDFVESTVFEPTDSLLLMASSVVEQGGREIRTGDYFARTRHFDYTYDLFYRVAVYESETHFFQIVLWMPFENHCEWVDWADQITMSFKLLEAKETDVNLTEADGVLGDTLTTSK